MLCLLIVLKVEINSMNVTKVTVYMFTADVVYCDSVSFLEQHFVFIEVSSCLFPCAGLSF